MAILKDWLQVLPKLFRGYYTKNISHLFDIVLLYIQADSDKYIH